jgi:hypothetical protein
MEQKLELKDLAPYLPYGIPAILSPKGIFNQDDEYPNPRTKELGIVKNISIWEPEITGQLHISDTYSFDFDEIDEICICLRPLSDLTNIIEVNRGWFYPLDVIYKIWYEKDLSPFSKRILNDKICLYPESMPYWLVQKLIKWHFDIFGLIEKGLAISYNDL